MSVKARMLCHAVRDQGDAGKMVEMVAVYDADKSSPNYSFSQATPSGNLALHITNPDAYDQFEQGATYDLTFEKFADAPAKPEADASEKTDS